MEEVQEQLGALVMAVLQEDWLEAKMIAREVLIEFHSGNGVPRVVLPKEEAR